MENGLNLLFFKRFIKFDAKNFSEVHYIKMISSELHGHNLTTTLLLLKTLFIVRPRKIMSLSK